MTAIQRQLHAFAVAGELALLAVFLPGPAALADDSYKPPHIDLSYPNMQPEYPAKALADGEEGSVVLDVDVKDNGRAKLVRVYESSGYADLDTAAVQTVWNWRFVPAQQSGETMSGSTYVKIDFRLPPAAVPPPTH